MRLFKLLTISVLLWSFLLGTAGMAGMVLCVEVDGEVNLEVAHRVHSERDAHHDGNKDDLSCLTDRGCNLCSDTEIGSTDELTAPRVKADIVSSTKHDHPFTMFAQIVLPTPTNRGPPLPLVLHQRNKFPHDKFIRSVVLTI